MVQAIYTDDSNLFTHLERRIYHNSGNAEILELVTPQSRKILDIGCGTGANVRLLKEENRSRQVYGITCSEEEAVLAGEHVNHCWVFDIEGDFPEDLAGMTFDTLIFSHVLEHLRDPAHAVANFCRLLTPGGDLIIAVPNVLFWKQRIRFFRGDFTYESAGLMDSSHVRFFTFRTIEELLRLNSLDLTITNKGVEGSTPLWFYRHHVLNDKIRKYLDRLGCQYFPNLFGQQLLIKARKADREQES